MELDDNGSINMKKDVKVYNIYDEEKVLMDTEEDSLKEFSFADKREATIEANGMTAQELARFYEYKYLENAKRSRNPVWEEAFRMYRYGSFESKTKRRKVLRLI